MGMIFIIIIFSEPKPPGGFLGVVNQVAPKTNIKRSHSVAAPGSAASKKAALLYWCQSMVEDKVQFKVPKAIKMTEF